MTATVQATAKKSRTAVKPTDKPATTPRKTAKAAQPVARQVAEDAVEQATKKATKKAVKQAATKAVKKAAKKATTQARKPTAQPAAQPQAPSKPAARHAVVDHPPLDLARNPTDKGRRLAVRRSGVHGKGVFAVLPLKKGEVVVEYVGEVITWAEALRRHPHDPSQPDHTFYFHIDDETVIDGKVGGNASRWINHSCAPNLEADDESGRVFLRALRRIAPGEELFFDYGLVIDERYTPALKKRFECRCGAAACRGTMLAPKRGKAPQASA